MDSSFFKGSWIVSILLLFLFPSLFVYSDQAWLFSQIKASHPYYSCGKIFYPVVNPMTGLELTLMRGSYGLRGTVHVRCGAIPAYREQEEEAITTLFIEGEPTNFVAARFEGGQELLLPDEMVQLMVASWQEGKTLLLYLDGYEATIPSCNFCSVWKKLSQLRLCTGP